MPRHRGIVLGFIVTASAAGGLPALAAGQVPIAGDYACASGCRETDAPPSIEIEGDKAHCLNEFGGTYEGKLLTPRSVSCFNKTGTLSQDGKTILWDNGAVWKRR